MKRLLLGALLFASAAALASQSVSVSGRWEVTANVGGTSSNMECTFSDKDGELLGKCTSDQAEYEVKGKVEGKTVTWVFNTQYEGQTLTVTYSGTLESADKMAGTVDVQPLSVTGDFSAKRAK